MRGLWWLQAGIHIGIYKQTFLLYRKHRVTLKDKTGAELWEKIKDRKKAAGHFNDLLLPVILTLCVQS